VDQRLVLHVYLLCDFDPQRSFGLVLGDGPARRLFHWGCAAAPVVGIASQR
jgi:hypothetical protein